MQTNHNTPRILIIAFSLGVCIESLIAQEPEPTAPKLSFAFPEIAKPADPNPTVQSVEHRIETLRKRTKEAIALLEKGDLKTFWSDFINPFWLAEAAAAQKKGSVDDLFVEFIASLKLDDEGRNDALLPDFLEIWITEFKVSLKASLTREPHFLLQGRAASFMEGDGAEGPAEFWIYVDGKWRISPKT